MGRSVDYLSNSHTVCYEDISWMRYDENEEYCELQASDNWDFWKENIVESFKNALSLEDIDTWEGREVHVILEDEYIQVAVSEYCNLASISMSIKDPSDYLDDEEYKQYEKDANERANKVGKWMEENVGDLVKVGGFSDGTSIYEIKGE